MNWYWAAYEADMFGHIVQANTAHAGLEQRHRREGCDSGLALGDTITRPTFQRRAIRRAALIELLNLLDASPTGDTSSP